MEKNVIISVVGVQTDLGQMDEIEMITSGQYMEKNGKTYITYKETEITGIKDTTTTIKVEEDKVAIMRFGSNNSTMIFELGKKHTTYYDTPHGCFTISTSAKELKVDLGEQEGEIYVRYELEIDHMSIGMNSFHITIRDNEENKRIIPLERQSSQIQIQ